MNPPLQKCLCITLIFVCLGYTCYAGKNQIESADDYKQDNTRDSLELTKDVDNENIDSTKNRVARDMNSQQRLNELKGELMYWYFDQGGIDDVGDLQTNIHSSAPQIHKNLNFELPFFGRRFNYTRVSLHGYLEFTDPPERLNYPLVFPNKEWPKENDPSFIGIFYSRMRIGSLRQTDGDQRSPGVYFRLENDLQTRTDVFGVEMRERLTWDIRTGITGADAFKPKHAVIVTWKNMSFAGGIDNSLYLTNTLQIVLATDEVSTYAIFNYRDLQWTSHTEAGGDTSNGEGGISAFVGFNAGNGAGSFEYLPYSQSPIIRDLTKMGSGGNIKGRHIFKIDEIFTY